MKTIKATEILSTITRLNNVIKNDWAIIKTHIDHDTTTIPDYDLMNVLKEIKKYSADRVEAKLYSICINIGFVSVEQLPKTSSYRTIYELSELESQHRELYALKNRTKRKGKHIESLIKDSVIDKEIVALSQKIVTYKDELTKFNDSKNLVVNEKAA